MAVRPLCSCSCDCILIGLIAILILWKPGCRVLEDFGCFQNGSKPNESTPCNPSPGSWSSCCSRNKVISRQMLAMKGGDGCVPNIGSSFLGASVASTRDTQPYHHPNGSPLSQLTNKPEEVIAPGPVVIGKNWHFSGTGALVIQLFYPAHISGFTLIHPAACQIPARFEKSAPKDFYVMGLKTLDEAEPFQFGNFSYIFGKESAQQFPVKACSKDRFEFIEFRFLTNYGNPNYTALYKVRIHGDVNEM